MFHLDNNSGITTMPTVQKKWSDNTLWFTEGGQNSNPSYPGADWFNIVQAELLNVLTEAKISPSKTSLNQLTLAIKQIISGNTDGFVKKSGDTMTGSLGIKTDNYGLIFENSKGNKWLTRIHPDNSYSISSWDSVTNSWVFKLRYVGSVNKWRFENIDDVTINGESTLTTANAKWYSKAIGEVVAFDDIDLPPTNLTNCRYVKLSANDSYNADVLINQAVSGSAPLIIATAVVSLAGSKFDGKMINLINTENRYIVANTKANILRDDAIQNITGNVGTGMDINQGSGISGPFYKKNALGSAVNQPGAFLSYWIMFDLNRTNRTDSSTHGRDISKTFYMRIL